MDKRKLGGFDKTTPVNKAKHESRDWSIPIFWLAFLYFGCFGLYYGIDFLINLIF